MINRKCGLTSFSQGKLTLKESCREEVPSSEPLIVMLLSHSIGSHLELSGQLLPSEWASLSNG